MRAIRKHLSEILWLAALVAVALAIGTYITTHERIHVPAWVPAIGQQRYIINAELSNAAGVMPGQGQAVTVSGVPVGEIAGVKLAHGRAVLRLAIKERFARVYPDATVLMRPKTGLKDMVAELDPGTPKSGKKLKSGATIGVNSTNPDVNFDEFLASLDADTRDSLKLLVAGAGEALGNGNGPTFANTLRRFAPLSRDSAKATRLVALRRVRLMRVMHNLSLLAVELGKHDRQLGEFVTSSNAVFTRFANQNENLGKTLSGLPPALKATDKAAAKLTRMGSTLTTGLQALAPSAKSLGPTLRELRPFFKTTAPVIKNQLRPFARDAQPTAATLVPAARHLARATPNLTQLTDVLNSLLNELAYNPARNKGTQKSYLFYVPWANHNTNSSLSGQDGISPLRRSMILVSCGQLSLLESLASPKQRNPTLSTLIRLLNAPNFRDLIAQKRCAFVPPPSEAAPAPAPAADTPAPAADAPAATAAAARVPAIRSVPAR